MDRVRREVSRNLVDAALAGGAVERLIQESFAPPDDPSTAMLIDAVRRGWFPRYPSTLEGLAALIGSG